MLLGAEVDRLLAVLDDGHNQVIWPPSDKARIDLARALAKLGKSAEARQAVADLRFRHPDFPTDDLQRRLSGF